MAKNNKINAESNNETPLTPDPAMIEKISAIQNKLHETFGKIALALMTLPRYKHQSVEDLNHILLDPLIRDRIAIATPKTDDNDTPQLKALNGIAIWASVSIEVDKKIREQINANVFPIRLKPDDWVSGDINWLLDVIAPTPQMATSVIANFKQVIKNDEIRIHPMVKQMLDKDLQKEMDAKLV